MLGPDPICDSIYKDGSYGSEKRCEQQTVGPPGVYETPPRMFSTHESQSDRFWSARQSNLAQTSALRRIESRALRWLHETSGFFFWLNSLESVHEATLLEEEVEEWNEVQTALVSLCPGSCLFVSRHQTSFLFLFFLLKSKSCCSVIYSNCSRKTQERGQRDALQSRKAQQKQKGGKSRRLHSMLEGEIDRDVEPALYFSFTGTSTYTHALIHPHPPPGNHIPSLLLSLSFAHYGGNRSD